NTVTFDRRGESSLTPTLVVRESQPLSWEAEIGQRGGHLAQRRRTGGRSQRELHRGRDAPPQGENSEYRRRQTLRQRQRTRRGDANEGAGQPAGGSGQTGNHHENSGRRNGEGDGRVIRGSSTQIGAGIGQCVRRLRPDRGVEREADGRSRGG